MKKSFNVNAFDGFDKDCLAKHEKKKSSIMILWNPIKVFSLCDMQSWLRFWWGRGEVSQGCKFDPYPPRQIKVWGWDLGFIEGNWPQFEQSGGTESILPVHICSPHDLGGGGLGQYVVILYTVWSAVRGEEVAVKAMLGNVMVVAMAELGQVSNSW